MKTLILLLAISCLGQFASAQNGIGVPRDLTIKRIIDDLECYNIDYTKDSIVFNSLTPIEYEHDKTTKYFKNGICYKSVIVGDIKAFAIDSADCAEFFTSISTKKCIWVFTKASGINHIVTMKKVRNKSVYTIVGYTDFKEYISDLVKSFTAEQ